MRVGNDDQPMRANPWGKPDASPWPSSDPLSSAAASRAAVKLVRGALAQEAPGLRHLNKAEGVLGRGTLRPAGSDGPLQGGAARRGSARQGNVPGLRRGSGRSLVSHGIHVGRPYDKGGGEIHGHRGRPGIVYILQGTITDHRNGVATNYGPGVGWPEDRNTLHWLENRGTVSAVEISVDIVSQE